RLPTGNGCRSSVGSAVEWEYREVARPGGMECWDSRMPGRFVRRLARRRLACTRGAESPNSRPPRRLPQRVPSLSDDALEASRGRSRVTASRHAELVRGLRMWAPGRVGEGGPRSEEARRGAGVTSDSEGCRKHRRLVGTTPYCAGRTVRDRAQRTTDATGGARFLLRSRNSANIRDGRV